MLRFVAEFVMEKVDVHTAFAQMTEVGGAQSEDLIRLTEQILSFEDAFLVRYEL